MPQSGEQSIQAEDADQRNEEQEKAGEIVKEALSGGFAKIVGDQHQHEHPDEVGEDRDRDHQGGDNKESNDIRPMPQVDVEEADCGQADDRVESGASGGNEQLVI